MVTTYSKAPEALVAGLAKNGDRRAFEELVRRRQSWLRNLMRRLCGDPALADDLAQQAFLDAWRNIERLRQPGSFGAWLKRTAINIWLQHCRRRDVLKNAEGPDDIEDRIEHNADIAFDLDRALAGLPDAVRLCIVLSYSEGMSHGEIAEFTGLPAGTVKSHIRRGTQRLKQTLSAYGDKANCEEQT